MISRSRWAFEETISTLCVPSSALIIHSLIYLQAAAAKGLIAGALKVHLSDGAIIDYSSTADVSAQARSL